MIQRNRKDTVDRSWPTVSLAIDFGILCAAEDIVNAHIVEVRQE